VLITDHGSTLYEYMVLGRPILYYDTEQGNERIQIISRLEKIRRLAYCFSEPEEAVELVRSLPAGRLSDSTDMAAARKECVEEVFYGVGGATDRAIAAIYDVLKIRPIKPCQA